MSYEVLAWTPEGLRETDRTLTVDFRPCFNRVPHPDRGVEEQIVQRWFDRVASKGSATLWNATKYRLHAAHTGVSSVETDGEFCMNLELGLTDYREYQGTNLCSATPLSIFGADRHLSQALGNACVLITADDFVVFLIRSKDVGEGEGTAVLPGGHPEPCRLGFTEIESDFSTLSSQTVVHELFEGVIDEVVEEVGVTRDELDVGGLKLMGVVARAQDRKAQMVFRMRCDVSGSLLNERWRRGGESAAIVLMPVGDLKQVAERGHVHGCALMPEHYGAVIMCSAPGQSEKLIP